MEGSELNKNNNPQPQPQQRQNNGPHRRTSRGAAIRAQKRTVEDANRIVGQYLTTTSTNNQSRARANIIDDKPRLKVIPLGGMDAGGSKNMIVVEYQNDAVVIDCGSYLGVDLPGINYAIADSAYLESIRSKLRAYIITHGHLDHIGGLPHIVPKFPAPIYGSKFTIGMVEKVFENFGVPLPEDFELKTVTMNEETHERLKVGEFFVELVRITHSIPGSTVVVLDTPVGRLLCTGDYRFDPNPLDHERSDVERLKQLGVEGVLVLLNECMCSERPGRTPSESTIEQSFIDIFKQAPGRVFVALFSSNINRIQMIVNAAVTHGRKIAMDGRSMVSTLEVAVKLGMVRIPKGTFVPIANAVSMKDDEIVVVCTGTQGEPSSALQRMSTGDHKHIKLKAQDTVVLSSTPIPESGNDKLVGEMVDQLKRGGVHVFRHATHELDGSGPLHVSGHCSLDEYMEMIDYVRPKFLVPIYGAYRAQIYHNEEAIKRGFPRNRLTDLNNGEILAFTADKMEKIGEVPHGTVLVDQTGAVVSSVVIKDRLILAEEGLVAVVLTIDRKSGQLLTSPDIISRGYIYMRDEENLVNGLRNELKRAITQRFKRVELDRFKIELREHVTQYLFEQTGRSPIVIPVVNLVGGGRIETVSTDSINSGTVNGNAAKGGVAVQAPKTGEQVAYEQQLRFQAMRAKLLGTDQPD